MEALIAFFPSKGDGAIGALDWTKAERQKLVPQSRAWKCPYCKKPNEELVPELKVDGCRPVASKYAAQIAQMHIHKAPEDGPSETKDETNPDETNPDETNPDETRSAMEAEGLRRRRTEKTRSADGQNDTAPKAHEQLKSDDKKPQASTAAPSASNDGSDKDESEWEVETEEERQRREWRAYAEAADTYDVRVARSLRGPPRRPHWATFYIVYFFSAVLILTTLRRVLRLNGYPYI